MTRPAAFEETAMFRAFDEMEYATGILSLDRRVNVLLIGVGRKVFSETAFFERPYEIGLYQPYVLAALLESRGIDYKMGIMDINLGLIEIVKTQEEIQVVQHIKDENVAFERYVNLAALEGCSHRYEDGFSFAPIPKGFKSKRERGEVESVEGDVSKKSTPRDCDLVVCTNVMRYLDAERQEEALKNIRSGMKKNAYLITNLEMDCRNQQEFVDESFRLPQKLKPSYQRYNLLCARNPTISS